MIVAHGERWQTGDGLLMSPQLSRQADWPAGQTIQISLRLLEGNYTVSQ